jgi:hypothetical protein
MKTGTILIILGILAGIAALWFFFLKKEYKVNSYSPQTKVANVTANGKTYNVTAGTGFVSGKLTITVEPNESGKFIKVRFKEGNSSPIDVIFNY